METKHAYDFTGWWADSLGLTREEYIAYYQANQVGLGIDEKKINKTVSHAPTFEEFINTTKKSNK